MDLDSQEQILKLSELHGPSQLMVIIGAPDPEAAEITAETVVQGDPSYAGVLAGAQLGLEVYHVLDESISSEVPPEVWDAQIGVMGEVLEADALVAAVAGMRQPGTDAS